jgi:hypothetical protein
VRTAESGTVDQHAEVAEPADPTPAPRFSLTGWRGTALAMLVFTAVAAIMVSINVARAPGLSIFDEMTHIDYAWRVAHGHVPHAGARFEEPMMREMACHGFAIRQVPMPPCGLASYTPSQFPHGGEDYNWGHPPVYYAITGGIARLAGVFTGPGHFIDAARLVGIGWLAAAMMVAFSALRRFGVPALFAGASCVLLGLTPLVVHACSTVNNDAAAPLAGALALYVLARTVADRRINLLLIAVLALFATGTKVISSVPFLAVAAVLVVVAIGQARTFDRRHVVRLLLAAGVIVGSVLFVYLGWQAYQHGKGVPNWVNPVGNSTGRAIRGNPFREWSTVLFEKFPPVTPYFLSPTVDGELVQAWARGLSIVLGAATLGILVASRRWSPRWIFGLAAVGGLIALPLVIEIQLYQSSHQYFPSISARYGLSFLPWCVAAVAMVTAARCLKRTIVVGTTIGAIALIATMGGLL